MAAEDPWDQLGMEHKELKLGTGDAATSAARERESDRPGIVSEYLPSGAASAPLLDSLARIASRTFDAPIAFLALVGSERVHFLARVGLASVDAPRRACPCDHVARFGDELVIEDASVDARFADAAIVRVDPKLRFLAAVPLLAPEGAVAGALCVGDTWPRRASAAQMEQLRNLAAIAIQRLLSNRQEAGLRRVESELELHTRHFHNSVDLNCIADREGHLLEINRRWTDVLGWDVESMRGRSYTDFVHEDDLARTAVALAGLNEGRNLAGLRIRYRRKDGGYVRLEWTAHAPAPGDSRIFAVARKLEALAQVAVGTPRVVTQLLVKDGEGAPLRVEVGAARLKSSDGAQGDLLLSVTDLSQRLALEEASREKLRLEADLCVRVGGGEFAIFRADISPETTEQRVQSLLNTLRAGCFIGDRLVTASVGVAHSADVGADASFETLYRAADRALYAAKQSGRDRVVRNRPPASAGLFEGRSEGRA